ncbi:MAG: c-type cytochrome [Deltaproteobacteria bacterium]|nr:c-type cytochrome [Deltaproteobacteria bacterium]
MKLKLILAVLIFAQAITLGLSAIGHTAGAPTVPKVPKGWKFTFPDGDAKSGKTVFMNMQCYSCHAIKIPGEKLPPSAGGIGPDLTGYSVLPKEYLAESIIKAHTVVAAPGYVVKEGKAAMGNYNHFMTIQEMIDIVAFLKRGLEAKGK